MTKITGGLKITGGMRIGGIASPPPPTPGMPALAADSPFGAGNSYLFNGTDQKLTVDASSLNLGSDWTIEWFQKETVSNPYPRPFMTVNGFGVSIENGSGGDPGEFYFWPVGLVDFGPVNRMNAWHHFAISTIGGTANLYFDGNLVNIGGPISITTPSFAGDTLWIGGKPAGSTVEQFGGYITNFRWTEGVGVYTGNFTVPNSPLQSTQGGGTNINAITSGQVKILIKP